MWLFRDVDKDSGNFFERNCNFNRKMRNVTFLLGCITFPISLSYVGMWGDMDVFWSFVLGVLPLVLAVMHYICFILGERDEDMEMGGIEIDNHFNELGKLSKNISLPTSVTAKVIAFEKHRDLDSL